MNTVEKAFHEIRRQDFIPGEFKATASFDVPLPIGFGQTISQPTTVRLMFEWLGPKAGHKVLDVGSGSGWTTALLSKIVGVSGKVYAVELIPELWEIGQANCRKVGCENAKFFLAGEEFGLPKSAPYDRILVSAAAKELPKELIGQLKVGGKLVVPVLNDVLEIKKTGPQSYETKEHHGFVFVPLLRPKESGYRI